MSFSHIPVLLKETLEILQCKPGDIVVDATIGGGGHAFEIMRRIIPGGMLIGIDRDHSALEAAYKRLESYKGAFALRHGNFIDIKNILAEFNIDSIDCMIMDLGVSSHQLDAEERGFSYRQDALLDMRMDPSQHFSAHDVVNKYDERELTRIIGEYGEERWAKRIARFVIENRPINTTKELEEVIKMAVPAQARRDGPHPARRTFQGIRIEVNQEIALLPQAVDNAVQVLKTGGRLCVISFHSLEDRVVKHKFRRLSGLCTCSSEYPVCVCEAEAIVKVLTPRPTTPGNEELSVNPRARSAKLRACHKL